MKLIEAKSLFPEQPTTSLNAFGYIYVTFNIDEGLFYIGKQSNPKWNDSYFGSGSIPQKWVKEKKLQDRVIVPFDGEIVEL